VKTPGRRWQPKARRRVPSVDRRTLMLLPFQLAVGSRLLRASSTSSQSSDPIQHSRERYIYYDSVSDVKIVRATSFPTFHSNLYTHTRSFTPDSKVCLFWSMTEPRRGGLRDLYRVNTDGNELVQLTRGKQISGVVLHPLGQWVYYVDHGRKAVQACDIWTGREREVVRFDTDGWGGMGSFTDDGRLYCCNASDGTSSGAVIVDTQQGTARYVPCRSKQVGHLQIEPASGEWLIYSTEPDVNHFSLRAVHIRTGEDSALPLPRSNGHFGWLGPSGRVFSALTGPESKIVTIAPGEKNPQLLIEGPPYLWHPGCDPSGQWIVSDTNWPDRGLQLISTRSRRMAYLCASGATGNDGGGGHPEPVVSPGGRFVVFNSDRSGIPHIYIADIPESLRLRLQEP
jgi:oligogalacturonide lyase